MNKKKKYSKPTLVSQEVFTATLGCTWTKDYPGCILFPKHNVYPQIPRT